jgi:hypothetical protein
MTAKPFGPVLRHLRRLAAPAAEPASDRALLERFTAGHDEAAFPVPAAGRATAAATVTRRVAGIGPLGKKCRWPVDGRRAGS